MAHDLDGWLEFGEAGLGLGCQTSSLRPDVCKLTEESAATSNNRPTKATYFHFAHLLLYLTAMDSWPSVSALPPPAPGGGEQSQQLNSSSAHVDALLSSAAGYSSQGLHAQTKIDLSSIDSIDASLALTQARLSGVLKSSTTVDAWHSQPAPSQSAQQGSKAKLNHSTNTGEYTSLSSTPLQFAASAQIEAQQRGTQQAHSDDEPLLVQQQLQEALADRNAAEREIAILSTQLKANQGMAVEWEADVRRLRDELAAARRMLAEIDTHKAGPTGSIGSDLQQLTREFTSRLAQMQSIISSCATQGDLEEATQRAVAALQQRLQAQQAAQHRAVQAEAHQHAAAQSARNKAELVALEQKMVAELNRVSAAHDDKLRYALDQNARLEEALAAARGAKARLEGEVATLHGKVEEAMLAVQAAQRRQEAAAEAARHAARSANATAAAGMQRLDSHVALLQNTHRELSTALEDVRSREMQLRAKAASLAEQEQQLQTAKAEHKEALDAAGETQAHVDERLAEAHRAAAAAQAATRSAAEHEARLAQREGALRDREGALQQEKAKLAAAQAASESTRVELEGRSRAVEQQQVAATEAATEAASTSAAAHRQMVEAKDTHEEAEAMMAKAEQMRSDLEKREQAVAEREQAVATATTSQAAAAAELEARESRVKQKEETAATAMQSAQRLQAEVAAQQEAISKQREEMETATRELRSEQAELLKEQQRLQQQRDAAEQLQRELTAREAALSTREATEQAGAGEAAKQVGQLQEEIAALKLQLQEIQQQLQESHEQCSGLQARLQAEQDARQADSQQAQQQAASMQQQVSQLQAQVSSLSSAAEEGGATAARLAEAERRTAAAELALRQTVSQNEELRGALGAARQEREVHVAALLALRQHMGAVLGGVGDAMLSRVGGGSVAPTPTAGAPTPLHPLASADARRVQQVLQTVQGTSFHQAGPPAGLVSSPPPFPGAHPASPPQSMSPPSTRDSPGGDVPTLQLPAERRRATGSPAASASTSSPISGGTRPQQSAASGSPAGEGGSTAETTPPQSVDTYPGEAFVMHDGCIGLVAHCPRLGVTIDTAVGTAAELGATALNAVADECAAREYLQRGDALWRAIWPAVVPPQGSFKLLADENGGFLPEGSLRLQQGAHGAVDANMINETVDPAQKRLRSLLTRASPMRPLVLLFRRPDDEESESD